MAIIDCALEKTEHKMLSNSVSHREM